jgi:MFS family permease
MSRDLLLVAMSMFTWGLGEGLFLYFQPLLLQRLGASPLGIGAVYGVIGVFLTLSMAPAGYLADRVGRRPIMWLSWMIGTLAAWVMALAGSLPIFVAGMVLYGITGFVMPPANSYVTAARGKWPVGRAVALVSGFYNLGAVIGPITGGWIGTRFGMRSVFSVAGGIFILSTLMVLFIRRQKIEECPDGGSLQTLMHNRRYLEFLGVAMLIALATYFPQPLTPNYLQNQRGLSLETIGQLGSVGNLGNAVLTLGIGQLSPPLGLLLGQISMGLYAALVWRGGSLSWLSLGLFFVGGYRAVRAMAVAFARPLVHGAQMGLAYGLIETAASLATIIAPVAAGAVYQRNPAGMYIVSLGLIASSLAVSVRFVFSRRTQAALAQTATRTTLD